jgi:hypothetical protein
MILDDRPHKLQYLITAPGYEDKNGDYHQGESRWEGDIPCRNVPAGKAEQSNLRTEQSVPIQPRYVLMLNAGNLLLEIV